MKLLKHVKCRDIAYQFCHKEEDCWLVKIYNINYSKISNQSPLFICLDYIPIDLVDLKEYEEIFFRDE